MRPLFLRRSRKVTTGAPAESNFLTTPLGAFLSIGVVVGGIYLLATHMGTTSGESKFS